MTDEEKAAANVEAAVKIKASEMLDKYKDAARLAEELAEARNETFTLRTKNRELKAAVPADGTLILSVEDAKKWTAFNELGAPEELKTKVETAATATAERDELKAEKTIARAAELSGFKPEVLADLARSKGFRLEIEGEGEAAKAVAHWKEGDKEQSKALTEYAESALPIYLDALRAEAATPARPNGVALPRMAAPGGGKTADVWDKIRQEKQQKTETANAAPAPSWTQQVGLAGQ